MKEKVLSLVSGGIDSPVASILAARKFEVVPLHFCLYPMSSRGSAIKALEALRGLKAKIGFEKAIILPWANILAEIRKKVKGDYACVVCRRSMFIAASKICRREKAGGVVTGESLGQKASQTLENISATSSGIEVPLLRPVLGVDKEEIIKISKERGIWRADHAGCCLAIPQNPKTKAKASEIDREIEKIDLQEQLVKSKELLLEVRDFDWGFDGYLLELSAKFG